MKKILIVDDSMFTRNIHKQIISEISDCQIFEAGNGAEAMTAYDEYQPDVVLMDLLMPDMDGLEVAEQIIARDSKAKIIICSTDKQQYRQQQAVAVGAVGFIVKPVDPELLLVKIEDILTENA